MKSEQQRKILEQENHDLKNQLEDNKNEYQKDIAFRIETEKTLQENLEMNQADIKKMQQQINELKDINSTLMKKLEEVKLQ